jgi:two-component system chemotaxis sensor kinase CheA
MQKIDKLFAALPRMVRDTSAELGKSVELKIEGADVELDREMIELIRDPLTHMVRNAIDHGIESPDQRRAARKPETGRLVVSAHQSGNQIVIEIADDGRGIDEARIIAKATALGIVTPEAVEAMTASQRAALIFAPGLSTADHISAISGRGVGMDVVRANIERIGGVIDIENRPRQGLRLTIRVPLTLTIISALTVTAGDQIFAIPRSTIEEIVHDSNEMIRIDALGKAQVASIRGRALPLVGLEDVLRLTPSDDGTGRTLVIVRGINGGSFALGVAAVHDHEELVIKPASPAIAATGIYAGMSLPDSGVPVLLLDISGIAEAAGVRPDAIDDQLTEAAIVAPEEDRKLVQTLLFRGFDGVKRGIRLALVERIDDVGGDQVRFSGGRLRIAIDGRILPLAGFEIMTDRPSLKILRLTDGDSELAYAVDEVLDIAGVPEGGEPASEPGPIAEVVLVDDEQIEILDPYWLFAEAANKRVRRDKAPLCLLADGHDRWTRDILRPLVEAAGYRVAFAGDVPTSEADVVIATSGDLPGETGGAQIVRLRSERTGGAGDNSVYRYDRAGLLAAIRNGVSAR